MTAFARLLRPGDWIKNVFVLLPLIFWLPGAGRGVEPGVETSQIKFALVAFAAFCLASSGWYAVNDSLDASEDRLHPVKKQRPVASGRVSAGAACIIGVGCMIGAIVLARGVNDATMWVIVAYLALQGLYNLRLKRVIFIDTATIASGFCLRAICGAMAIAVPVSIWLVLCVFFLTLYLAFIKRACDLSSASRSSASHWQQRAQYGDWSELNWLLSVSGGLTVLMYLMYTLSAHAQGIFGQRALGLALLTPLVLIVIHRFYRRALRGESDSPLDAIRTDGVVAASLALFGFGVYLILYVPGVEAVIRRTILI